MGRKKIEGRIVEVTGSLKKVRKHQLKGKIKTPNEKFQQNFIIYRKLRKRYNRSLLRCNMAFKRMHTFYINHVVETWIGNRVIRTFNWADHQQQHINLLNTYNLRADISDYYKKLMNRYYNSLSVYPQFMEFINKEERLKAKKHKRRPPYHDAGISGDEMSFERVKNKHINETCLT